VSPIPSWIRRSGPRLPLTARVRRELRKVGIAEGIRCVYSLEPAGNRRPVGTISYMPAIVGLEVVEEVLRMLLSPDHI